MRFRRLDIPAFGPFTGFSANYGSGAPDFHLVFGPNEAGKSSLLRAISALLYGIPVQSDDNFLHDYKDLRLSAEIENRAGRRLHFTRAKGRKNTIRGVDGVALDDDVLMPFLGGVDEQYFDSVFGLDGDELKKGAETLLSRDGDLGQVLLATGTGGTLIQQTLDQFVQRSEQYFKGRARANVSIRPAANELKEQHKLVREHAVLPNRWAQIEQQLAERSQASGVLETACEELERELDWIGRCQDALPTVAQLNEKQRQLQQLPALPALAADFASRARESRDQAARDGAALKREQDNVARLKEQLQQCEIAPAILAEMATLDDLHRRSEVYLGQTERLQQLRRDLSAREIELATGMQAFGLTGPVATLDKLRIAQPVRLVFEEAAHNLELAQLAQSTNIAEIDKARQMIESDQATLADVPADAPAALQSAVEVASEYRQQYRDLPHSKSVVEKLHRALTQARALLPGVRIDDASLAALPVPTTATIRRYRDRLAEQLREIEQHTERREEYRQQQKDLRDELARLQRDGELPSVQALVQARTERDGLWAKVLDAWTGDRHEDNTALQQNYPLAVKRADTLADALRADAEKVALADQLHGRIADCHQAMDEIGASIDQLQSDLQNMQAEWLAQWQDCEVQVRSPDEMIEWREHWLDYRKRLREHQDAQDDVHRIERMTDDIVVQLQDVLTDADTDDFDQLYTLARQRVSDRDQAIGKRKEMQDRIQRQQVVLEQLQTKASQLERDAGKALDAWARGCRELEFDADTTVNAGRELMRQRLALLDQYDEWQKLSAEAAEIETDVLAWEQSVDECSARLATGGESVVARQEAMWNALAHARKAQDRHNTLSDQLQQASDELGRIELQARQSEELLVQHINQAQIDSIDALEPLLAKVDQRERLLQAIDTHQQSLAGLARSESVSEFVERVEREDSELLAARRSELTRVRADKQKELQTLRDASGELNREREQLARADDQAAKHGQRAASIAATLEADARDFIKLRLATAFLERQRDQFRDENQAPLLDASSKIFKAVTLGSFERLAPDYDARDEAVIVGERANGNRVPVEGMSEGTRDQLYLSLRLAALAQHMKNSEPMPLIMDDLLMTFDNQRSLAMLRQIAALAQHTQIFLFTHHRHLVEMCRGELQDSEYCVHEL
jgi:uncharacterized protein YhaN